MKIITTHLHADFDCLASMVAALKLYPGAQLVFPGSQEKNVREYLAQTDFHIPYSKLKNLSLDRVKQVIIVDASTKERVGAFARLVEKKDVIVHLYDHHVASKIDIPHELAVIRKRGSTVTIFCELLRERGVSLTKSEATLMAMGLYEDTGSLTFSSVCLADFEAARWLLEQGADLNAVSVSISRELTSLQIEMLDRLIKNLDYERIGSVTIAYSTASTPRYIGDLAVIANKLMDAETLSALFVLVRMGDRISLIARSRVEGVNVGQVAEKMGGGGHPSAASATIKAMTLPQAVARLKQSLKETLEHSMTAKEMMVERVVTAEAVSTITDIEKMMTRFNIGGAPVLDKGKVAGLITRQIVEKAIYLQMGEKPVSDFMINEFSTVAPDTPFQVVEELILGRRQKLAPVVDPSTGKMTGVISRGIVLNKLYGDSLFKPSLEGAGGYRVRHPQSKNVMGLVKELMPESVLKLFELVAKVADGSGYGAYVVGGFARDLLLRTRSVDLDIVIEGDGVDFARKLAKKVKGRVHPHKKFKTAIVIMPDGFKLDVATARIEYYAYPAALPTVETSAIRNDLFRRDFSINAMAIRLNGAKAYTLIDFFGGQADLKTRSLRVLHNLSFVEDPTRAYRAVRFEHRYGFTMGKQTISLLKNAVRLQLFNRLSGERLFSELEIILKERRPAGAVSRMKQLGLLKFIHPDLVFDSIAERLMDQCEDFLAWHDLTFPTRPARKSKVYFMALFDRLEKINISEENMISASAAQIIQKIATSLKRVNSAMRELNLPGRTGWPGAAPPSLLYRLFSPLSDEALIFLAAKSNNEETRLAVTRFFSSLKNTKPHICGGDILKLGVTPSKKVGAILDAVMGAQLDGEIKTKEEALDMARKVICEIKGEL